MKSARELFEELGYEQTKTEHFIKYTSKGWFFKKKN